MHRCATAHPAGPSRVGNFGTVVGGMVGAVGPPGRPLRACEVKDGLWDVQQSRGPGRRGTAGGGRQEGRLRGVQLLPRAVCQPPAASVASGDPQSAPRVPPVHSSRREGSVPLEVNHGPGADAGPRRGNLQFRGGGRGSGRQCAGAPRAVRSGGRRATLGLWRSAPLGLALGPLLRHPRPAGCSQGPSAAGSLWARRTLGLEGAHLPQPAV